jgi:hypothetical protein
MRRLSGLGLAVGLLLLLASPTMSDYSLKVSTTAQGGGMASNETQNLSYIVGQASPVGIGSNSTSTVLSGLATLFADFLPPAIMHSPPTLAVPDRTALEITADIEDNRAGVAAAVLHYRQGDSETLRQVTMSLSGGAYSGSIPPSAVTERGLLYYIQATDLAGNVSRFPLDAPDSLISVRVWFEDLQSAFEIPAGQYRMISLPGSTGGNPDEVLVDDLGSYDSKVWRLGRWNPSIACSADCYDEYPTLTDMDRGKAFWLITKSAKHFDFSGLSTLPESPFRIHLDRGWNQIGTPFAFTTDWLATEILFDGGVYALNEEHLVGSDTLYVEDNLVSYDGTYHGHESLMEPWSGYWIYNGSTQDVDLLVSPHGLLPALASSHVPRGDFDALIEIAVSSPDFPERAALAGLSPGARDGWDAMDHREPPPIDDQMRVVFERPAWGGRRGLYMTDIRHSSEEGAHWTFRVEASKATSATLELLTESSIPQAWDVFLYDQARGLRVGADDLPYRFELDRTRELSLIAGTEEYIRLQETEAGIALRAQIVGVSPNPFRGSVNIVYFTPGPTRTQLDVYSVEGRLVRTLDRLDASGGIREITWDGRSERSGDVAPGLYFARLRIGGATETVKGLKIQ